MSETEKEGSREHLPLHPDVTDENSDEKISVYQQRNEEKKVLTEERDIWGQSKNYYEYINLSN